VAEFINLLDKPGHYWRKQMKRIAIALFALFAVSATAYAAACCDGGPCCVEVVPCCDD
jgi:hypothetical protein